MPSLPHFARTYQGRLGWLWCLYTHRGGTLITCAYRIQNLYHIAKARHNAQI